MSEQHWSSVAERSEPSADIVVGLGWGDEGKGATVDALVASKPTQRVVRFNGGQQAEHNVIANGIHHTFSSIGSGAFSNVPTFISKYCTVDPIALENEYVSLYTKGFGATVYVDRECLVTTPIHIAANIIRERENGHGTTGTGFGETVYYAIEHHALRAKHLHNADLILVHLRELRDFYIGAGFFSKDTFSYSMLREIAMRIFVSAKTFHIISHNMLLDEISYGHTVFEGAQGFVLDENFGFHPHTTWSTTTPHNARKILREAGVSNVTAIGCLRTYATRHGNGPLPLEGSLPMMPEELHNGSHGVQGAFRVAPHDMDIVNWAIDMTGVDSLAVSHYDVFNGLYTSAGIVEELSKPIIIKANGPRREDRIFTWKQQS